jgi:hypothetical protein
MRARRALQRLMQAPTKLTRWLFCLNGLATQGEKSSRIVKHRIMAGNSARLLVAALLCLSACTQLAEPLISTGLEEEEQIKQPVQGETCAKLKELRVGMTASQVVSACERRPLRTSDIITRDGKKIAVWSYGSSYLHMADDKLIHIFGP